MPDPPSLWRREVRLPPRRADAAALAALVALVLALYGRPLVDGTVYFQRDVQLMWLTHARAFVEAVHAGEWPTWNPWIAFGQPLWADANTQVLYPPTWLLLVLAPWRYYILFVVGHLLLAGTGTYALSRTLAFSRTAALATAAVWVCSGPLASQVPVWNQLAGAAWMPWTVLFAVGTLRTRRLPPLVLWGGGHALQILAGAPEAALMTLAGVGAVALAMVLAARPRPMLHSAARALGAMAAAGAIALGLSAGQWVPSLEMAQRSERGLLSEAMRTQWSVHPIALAQALVPVALPDVPFDAAQRRGVFESTDFVPSLYLGAAALGLAGIGLAGPRRRFARGLFLCLAAAVAIALGRHAPFEHGATTVLPFLRSFRYPVKAMIAASFAASLMCGLGLDAWRAGPDGRRGRALAPLGAIVGIVLASAVVLELAAGGAPLSAAPTLGAAAAHAMRFPVAVALFAAFVVLLLAARGEPSSRTAALIGALAVGDLAAAHATLNPAAPEALFTHRPPAVSLVSGDAPQRLYVQDYFWGMEAPRLLGRADPFDIARAPVGWSVPASRALALRLCLFPPSAGFWGVRGSFEHDTPALAPTDLARLTAAVTEAADTPGRQVALLRAGAVRHVLLLHEPAPDLLEPVGTVDCLLPAPGRIFRVPESMPRAHVVGHARQSDTVADLADPAFDPRREVLLAPGGPAPLGGAGRFEGGTTVLYEGTTRVTVRSQTTAPGYLVLADAYDPGWLATVDGRPAEVRRANVSFRAVAVPSGIHDVEFRYRPRAVRHGLFASGSACVLVLAGLAAARRVRSPHGCEGRTLVGRP